MKIITGRVWSTDEPQDLTEADDVNWDDLSLEPLALQLASAFDGDDYPAPFDNEVRRLALDAQDLPPALHGKYGRRSH